HETAGVIVRIKERLDFGSQLVVAAAGCFQITETIFRRALQRAFEYLFHLLPAIGIHREIYLVSSRCSHARAMLHSRAVVARDIFTIFAVSSKLRPLK